MITASYLYVPEVLIPGIKLHSKLYGNSFIGTQIAGAFIFIGALSAIFTIHASLKEICIPLLGGFWLFFLPFYFSFSSRRRLAKQPLNGLTVYVTFTEEAFSTRTSKSEAKLAWDLIQMAGLAKEGVLLYSGKTIFNWIPRSAFQSQEDYEACIALVERKVKKIKRKGV